MIKENPYPAHPGGGRRHYAWRHALALLLMGAILTACAGQRSAGEGDAGAPSVGDVLADPAEYTGQQLTLSGQVRSALSPQAFRMQEARGGLFGGVPPADGLLVVIAEGAQRPLDVDGAMTVQVTGELQIYDPESFEATADSGLDPAFHDISAGDPLLLAEQVRIHATISDIDENPGAYVHNEVTVSGRVAEVLGEGIVRLEDPEANGDLLVVASDPAAESLLREGQRLEVTGQVRQFNLDELGGEFDLDRDGGVFAGWANRPVILADSVRAG